MSVLPVLVTQTSASANESEQVILASRVEHARRYVLETLLENNDMASYIVTQLFTELRHGDDASDIILLKKTDEYSQSINNFVTACAEQLGELVEFRKNPLPWHGDKAGRNPSIVQVSNSAYAYGLTCSAGIRTALLDLHFLPVYLIETSTVLEKSLHFAGMLDAVYRTRLRSARAKLQSLRQEMISCNAGLVAFVAHKYRASSLSFDDLMQEGIVGLIKAVDRFNPERGNCFSTYAIYWIKQAISRLIVKQDKMVPLPVALAEKSAPVFDMMRNTFLNSERWPTLAELKASCDLSEQEIKTISSYFQSTFLADTSSEDGMAVMEKMQQYQFSQPLDNLIDTDLAAYVDKAVSSLPEKQAIILAMRFGLKNHTEMTLQAVADQLQVTRERVRQIQNEALQRLKQQFGFDLMLFLEPKDT
jgi:RNA polymerase primary sigma factor